MLEAPTLSISSVYQYVTRSEMLATVMAPKPNHDHIKCMDDHTL